MTIQLKPRKTVTQVASVSLVADDEGGAINTNPDFRYGELQVFDWIGGWAESLGSGFF